MGIAAWREKAMDNADLTWLARKMKNIVSDLKSYETDHDIEDQRWGVNNHGQGKIKIRRLRFRFTLKEPWVGLFVPCAEPPSRWIPVAMSTAICAAGNLIWRNSKRKGDFLRPSRHTLWIDPFRCGPRAIKNKSFYERTVKQSVLLSRNLVSNAVMEKWDTIQHSYVL